VGQRLRTAALELLRAGGPTAVTVQAVAARSGTAKTTIYRRYANRADLLRAAVTEAIGEPEPLPEGSVREKIRYALEQVWGQMDQVLGPGGLAAIVMDTDPEFTDLFRKALRPFDEALAARIEEDARAGILRADVDADGIVTLFVGAYIGGLVRRGRVEDSWMDRCLEMMWATLAPRGTGSADG
jgi:AcrR family transcriptional regulator